MTFVAEVGAGDEVFVERERLVEGVVDEGLLLVWQVHGMENEGGRPAAGVDVRREGEPCQQTDSKGLSPQSITKCADDSISIFVHHGIECNRMLDNTSISA